MLVNYNGRTGGIAGVGINVNQQFTATTDLPAVSLAQVGSQGPLYLACKQMTCLQAHVAMLGHWQASVP